MWSGCHHLKIRQLKTPQFIPETGIHSSCSGMMAWKALLACPVRILALALVPVKLLVKTGLCIRRLTQQG
jgi:hypothetical protein